MEANEETEKIAQTFEAIFGQKDMKPTSFERKILEDDLANIRTKMKTEKPHFTYRELEQAMRKASMRSAKGPDGIRNNLVITAYEIPPIQRFHITGHKQSRHTRRKISGRIENS